MNPDRNQNLPDQPDAVADMAEALAAGRPFPSLPEDITPEARQRLREAQALLLLLDLDRQLPGVDQTLGVGENPTLINESPIGPLQKLGRYNILSELGHGGYGVVYLADDPVLHREVALKVLRTEAVVSPASRRRFLQEGRAAAELEHPHLVPVYDVGEAGSHCYLVARYCRGGSLADYLSKWDPPVPTRDAADLIAKLAQAVDFMHRRGILHRDVKPSNILLEPVNESSELTGRPTAPGLAGLHPRLGDFGLVKFFGSEGQELVSGSLGSQPWLGTPAYMAPEQVQHRSSELGPPADVHALGVVLYELLTGKPLFGGSDVLETVQRVVTEEPKKLRPQRRDVSRDLETICLKCLAKDPRGRYASAGDLALDLQRFLAGESIRARRPSATGRAFRWLSRRPLVPLVASLVLAIAGFATYTLLQQQQQDAVAAARDYGLGIAEVQDALTQGSLAALPGMLNRLRPQRGGADLRGFEWFYLWQEMWNAGPRWQGGNFGPSAIRFDPLGSMFLLNSGPQVLLVDASTGQRIGRFDAAGTDLVRDSAIITDDSEMVAWSQESNNLRMHSWSMKSGIAFSDRMIKDAQLLSAAITSNRKFFRVITTDGIREYDRSNPAAPGRSLERPPAHYEYDGGLLTHDARFAVVHVSNRWLRWYDLERSVLLGSWPMPACPGPPSFAFSPDNRLLAFSLEGYVSVFDVALGNRENSWNLDRGDSFGMCFSPDGRYLATSAPAGRGHKTSVVHVWDWRSRQPVRSFLDPELGPSIVFSPNGKSIAFASKVAGAGVVRIWRLEGGNPRTTLAGHDGEVWALSFAAGGQTLASSGDDKSVRLWDAHTGRERAKLPHDKMVGCLALDPIEGLLASGCDNGQVYLWNPTSGEKVAELPSQGFPIRSLAYSSDGKYLAVAGKSKKIVVFDRVTRAELFQLASDHEHVKRGLVFSPAGKHLTAGDCSGRLWIWDIQSKKLLSLVESQPLFERVAYSPNGSVLASAHVDGTVRLRNPETGLERQVLAKHRGEVVAVAFSPDGRTLASAGADHHIRLWQVANGQLLLSLTGPTQLVNDLAFSPDGRTLVAACHDGRIYRWLASPNDAEPPIAHGLRAPLGDGDYSGNSSLPVPGSPIQIAVQDLESRGIPEVLVLCADAQAVKAFVLPKVGNIEAFKTYNAPLDAASFVVADLNRNGAVDMAFARTEAKSLDVRWNRDHIVTFQPALFDLGEPAGFLAAGDFDGDSTTDLLCTLPQNSQVQVLLSRSREHLASVNKVSTKANPVHLAVGDMDRDGKLDFVVAQAKHNSIGVFRGKGDGQFTFVCDLPVPNRPIAVALADFDNDGLLDIAVVREDGGGISVIMNKGRGKFEPRLDLRAGDGCCALVATDLDDDGATDIAVVSANDNALTLYMGKGDGTFQNARIFPTGSKPSCISTWDVNQDGVKDLLIGCRGEKTVRIHLGKRRE